MKVRVYELAKMLEKDNKEVKQALKRLGVEVKSHLTPVDEEHIKALKEMFKPSAVNRKPTVRLRKKKVEEPKVESPVSNDQEFKGEKNSEEHKRFERRAEFKKANPSDETESRSGDRFNNSDRRGSYNRDGNSDRRGSYSRDGNSDRRGSYNRDGNSDRRGSYSRDGNSDRRGSYNRDGNSDRRGSYSRDGNSDRRGSYNRDGNSDRRGSYNRDGNPDRRGSYNRDGNSDRRGSSFGRSSSFDRKPQDFKPTSPSASPIKKDDDKGVKKDPKAKGFAQSRNDKNKKAAREEENRLAKIANKSRRDNRKKKKQSFLEAQERQESLIKEDRIIKCPKEIAVKDLADRMGISPTLIVKDLFLDGHLYNVNSFIDFDLAESVAGNYNVLLELEQDIERYSNVKVKFEGSDVRPPVVTIMGHVDHGKTSLLDKIRSTKVTNDEAGGITQKIGAYQVDQKGKKITFIDTPGHEAFMDMRARGASITDIAILVVAADDGVMPQTKEAISHAKFAEIPIIIAVNKIDKQGANVEKIKQQLAEHNIVPPEWGGNHEFVEVSALTGQGIDTLLETILLQAEILDLKADKKASGRAVVVESKLDSGRGAIADIIIQNGSLKRGDSFVVGNVYGKVRTLTSDSGETIKEAVLSQPVQITGLSSVPEAGDILEVFKKDRDAKKEADRRKAAEKSDRQIFATSHLNDKEVRVIIKSGSKGGAEAVKGTLLKIKNDEVTLKIIDISTGNVTPGDITLAKTTDSIVLSFDSNISSALKKEANQSEVEVAEFSIIYKLLEFVEEKLDSLREIKYDYIKQGEMKLLKVFDVSNVGVIAGGVVLSGEITNKSFLKVFRDGVIIKEADILSLKREKDFVSKAEAGQECGVSIKNYGDFKEGDIIEAYSKVEIK